MTNKDVFSLILSSLFAGMLLVVGCGILLLGIALNKWGAMVLGLLFCCMCLFNAKQMDKKYNKICNHLKKGGN